MNKILYYLGIGALAASTLASCETYKVDEPGKTAVSWLDGRFVCAASLTPDIKDTVSVFDIKITNTTENDADKAWMYITDYSVENSYKSFLRKGLSDAKATSYSYTRYTALGGVVFAPAAYQFCFSCDGASKTFSVSGGKATEPDYVLNETFNYYVGQTYHYYSSASFADVYNDFTVDLSDGQLVVDGVDTPTGYKSDAISFTVTITNAKDASDVQKYYVKGMRFTGWGDDVKNYQSWMLAQ